MSKPDILRPLTPGETAMRLGSLKARPRSEFWLPRFTRDHDPIPPRIDATWDDVREWIAHSLITRDVLAVFSHLGCDNISKKALSDGGFVFRAKVPVVGGWFAPMEVETDPRKVAFWAAAVKSQTLPVEGVQISLAFA